MIRQLKIVAVLTGFLLSLGIGLASGSDSVTGVVSESGFTGVIINGIKYNTGLETSYTPEDYRPIKGDTVTVSYYPKTARNGEQILAVSTLVLVKKDPNRKELESPANGVVLEVGRKNIRFDFPATGQVVSMERKRGMEVIPTAWVPVPGDKVVVHFEQVRARFGNRLLMVIHKMEKAE